MSCKKILVVESDVRSLDYDGKENEPDLDVCEFFQSADVEAWRSLNLEDVEKADAVVIPGGAVDVNPELYGETNTGCGELDKELDKKLFAIIERAVQLKKPLFGICRGMQLISVYFGATMIQDIECLDAHKFSFENPSFHTLYNVPKSCMFEVYGSEVLTNSLHHQAIKKLPECLKVVQIWCRDKEDVESYLNLAKEGKLEAGKDCLIEAVMHKEYPYLGVQWHPEAKGPHICSGTVGKQVRDYFCSML